MSWDLNNETAGRALQEGGTAKEGKACVKGQQESPLRRVAGRFISIDK